ncbi:hypothetical protein BKI51_06620 [Alphaproteobacteria bacterium AO1-B]|nr:hypothetical protein BKI51_06620 [Alphaproteobacteria bacterium AO1-B]
MNADREWHPGWFWGGIIAAATVLFGWFVYAGYLAWPHVAQCTGLWRAQAEVGPFLQAMPAQYNPCLTLNEFGDFLAGTFAPLAFFGLIITVIIQSRELREQRKELSHSIEVAKAQKEEMAEQADFLGKQAQLMADTAKMNSEQQARRDFDTLVDIARPYIQVFMEDNGPDKLLPSPEYVRKKGLDVADTMARVREQVDLDDERHHARFMVFLRRVHALDIGFGAHLVSLKDRLGDYDKTLYVEYGFEAIKRELDLLLESYPRED